jgi:hypothetical protein
MALMARWRCSTFDGHPNESGRDAASETKVDEVVAGMSKRTTLVLIKPDEGGHHCRGEHGHQLASDGNPAGLRPGDRHVG